MQSISWTAFAVNNSLTKTVVHFLPSATASNAPYPVNFSLVVWAKDFEKRITLDGGRLGQPDGVRLDDVFPDLNDLSVGLLGVEIELSAAQPRIDISSSACVVEIISAGNSVRYYASDSCGKDKKSAGATLAIKDAYSNSSLIFLNPSSSQLQPEVRSLKNDGQSIRIEMPGIEARSVVEHSFDEQFFMQSDVHECSWGLFRARPVSLELKEGEDAVMYSICRDVLTKRIVSVSSI